MIHFFRFPSLFLIAFLYSSSAVAGGEHCHTAFLNNVELRPHFDNKNGEWVGNANLIPYQLAINLLRPHLTSEAFPFYEMIMTALWQKRIVATARENTIKGANERYLCLLGTLIQQNKKNRSQNEKFIDEMTELSLRFDDNKKIHRTIISKAISAAQEEKISNSNLTSQDLDSEIGLYESGITALDESEKFFALKY